MLLRRNSLSGIQTAQGDTPWAWAVRRGQNIEFCREVGPFMDEKLVDAYFPSVSESNVPEDPVVSV